MLYLDTITWRGEKTGGPHLWNPNRPRVHWSRSQPQSQLIVQCMPVHAQEHSGPTDCPWQKQEGVSPLLPTLPHHKWSHMRGSQHLLISEPEKCQRVQSKNMTENKDGGKMVVGENHVKISICKINNGKIRLSQKKYKILPLVVKKIHQKKHWKLQKKWNGLLCVIFCIFYHNTDAKIDHTSYCWLFCLRNLTTPERAPPNGRRKGTGGNSGENDVEDWAGFSSFCFLSFFSRLQYIHM